MVNAFNSNQEALESIGLDRIQTFDRPESTYSESWNKVREMHKIMSSPNSREYGLTKVLQPILDDVFEKTGKRFNNFGNAPKESFVSGSGQYATEKRIDSFDEELAKLNKHIQNSKLPGYEIITQQSLLEQVGVLARSAKTNVGEISKAGGPFGSQALPTMASYFGDMVSNPLYWPFLLYGNIPGQFTKEAMAKVFVQQFGAGAGYELVTRPQVKIFRESIGEEYTLNDMARDIGIGGMSAGVGGLTLNTIFAGVKKAIPSFKVPEKLSNQDAHNALKEAVNLLSPDNPNGHKISKNLSEELDPMNDISLLNHSLKSLKDDEDIINANPFRGIDGETEHIKLVNESLRNLGEYPDAAPINGFTQPLDMKKFQTKESIVEATLPEDQIKFNIDELEVDAKTFQFKSGTDEFGLSKKMKNVTKWEPFLADKILVFETKAGKKIVVDGHHRLGLAKKIIAQNDGQKPALYGHLFREVDGFTTQEVKTIGAAKNIANIQELNPMDIAKVLKLDRKKLESIGLDRTSEFYKQGNNLSKLGDDAWLMMENKVIDENYGALVGKMVDDVDKQATIIKLLNETKPNNLLQAESIINQALRAGFKTESQETLFGNLKVTETLFKERAVILDETLKRLKRDKQVFKTLVENQSQIESKGNQLVKNINKEMEINNATAEEILKRLAHTTGTIGDELTKAAKKFKETKNKRAAVDELSRVIRQEIQRGNISRDVDGRVGDAIENQKAEIMDPIPERTNIQGFEEPRGKVVEEQGNQLENVLKEELDFNAKESFQEKVELRQDLKKKMDEGLDDPIEIEKHPAVQDAYEQAAKIKPTNEMPGFGSDNWLLTRQFNFGNEKVIGYKNAINRFYDEFKKLVSDEPILKEKKAYIVIGSPAAGKSTVAEQIAKNKRAMIIDSDEVKKTLPEFNNGVGANAVHFESKVINDLVFDRAMRNGDNMLLPRVGHTEKSILKIRSQLKANGYTTELILSDVSPKEAFKRMISRFIKTGRLINIDYFKTIGLKPKNNYNQIKGEFDAHARIDQEGPQGSEKIVEQSEKADFRLRQSRGDGRGIRQETLEEQKSPTLGKDSDLETQAVKQEIEDSSLLDEVIEFQEPNLQSADGVISKNQTVREVFNEFEKDAEMLKRLKDCA